MNAVAWAVAISLAAAPASLTAARKGFTPKVTQAPPGDDKLVQPPAELFSIVEYPGKPGKLRAYLGKPAAGAKGKQPAIVWLVGGFPPGGMDATAWTEQDPANDQSAMQYRQAGIITMYPALRGTYGNPGAQESFYGEVDDVLAAIAYLRTVPTVDPNRIWLGGHSTGGTLALLAAEAGAPVAGVIAFGPVSEVCHYGPKPLLFDVDDARECELRAPGKYLESIAVPAWIIEGAGRGNSADVRQMQQSTQNPKLTFIVVEGSSHFEVLAPMNGLLAAQIAKGAVTLTAAEAQKVFDSRPGITVTDPEGWSAELPAGFSELHREKSGSNHRIFARGDLVVGFQRMNGVIGPESLEGEAQKRGYTAFSESWGKFTVWGLRMPQEAKGVKMVGMGIQVPIAPHAVIINVAGPIEKEDALRKLGRDVLAKLKGPTNWK